MSRRPAELEPVSQEESDRAEALAHYGQAHLLDELEQAPAKAIPHIEKALALDPDCLHLHLLLGSACLREERFADAIRVFQQACRKFPHSPEARLNLAVAYLSAEKTNLAIEEYRRFIKQWPERADGYIKLAVIHYGRQEDGEVLKVLDEALARTSEPLDVLLFCDYVARFYILNRKYAQAVDCLKRIEARQPDNLTVKEKLSHCHDAAGNRQKSLEILADLVQRQPTNMFWQYDLAEHYDEAGNTGKAIEHFNLALQAAPERPEPHVRLAIIYSRTDRALALATLRKTLETLPQEPLIHTFLGLLLSYDRSFKEAIASFEKAEKIVAESGGEKGLNPMFCFWYGAACEQSGEFERAEDLFERCIALYPDVHEPYNYLAYMWAEKGVKLDKALQYVTRALELRPGDAAYVDTLGWIYFKQGKYPEALAQIQQAARDMPDDPTIAEHLGDICEALGRTDDALLHWKASFLINPTVERVEAKLKKRGVDTDQLRKENKPARKTQ